ncbi:class II peroxidase [Aulographum hederae CBS 113979]|uniref:Peroxidase n=1 Tax=Aulographum hederae CBS 113979 TaxID=1176131 RepID=A0A6G1H489_9PEZI|nr:class II peroxidase [Aulographum hederae CBS 113979]
MATAAKTLARNFALRGSASTSTAATFRTTTTRNTARLPLRTNFRQHGRRGFASEAPRASGGSGSTIILALGFAAAAGGGYYIYTQNGDVKLKADADFKPTEADYQKVYDHIAELLAERDEYEDGSYGPVIVRLAWHASGTYDKETGTGGSNGATMRFDPEADHGANAGLKVARDFLEPVKEKFPWITHSDLWTLAGVAAIQEMQGPIVPWRPGRQDRDVSFCTPDGRLPDASQAHDHLRAIFYRMGFDDREIVALSGAHALGRCHTDRSGFDGPWTFSPTVVTNDYFQLLMKESWGWRKWDGPKQFEDKGTKTLMMLPTDMALVKDKKFKPWVEKYAKDNDVFFKDFSEVLMKLFELGVPFESKEEDRMKFKRKE